MDNCFLFDRPKNLEEALIQIDVLQKHREVTDSFLSQLNNEHSELGKIIIKIYDELCLAPNKSGNVKDTMKQIIADLSSNGIESSSKILLNNIFMQLTNVITILDMVIGGNIPFKEELTHDVGGHPKKVKLKIPCQFVNKTLRIGYLRDVKGIEHNFDCGGVVAFYITVEIDEYLLETKPREFNGVIG